MTEQQRSTTTVFVIAGAALGLCCVGSVAAMMLFGIGSPLALFRGDLVAVSFGAPPTDAMAPATKLIGAWSQGEPGISELGDRNAASWSSLQGEGRRVVFRANHSCELEALTRLTAADCTTWQFVSRGNCEWSIASDQLTLKLGPGTQLSKVCGKEVTESALPAVTLTTFVRFEDGQKRLEMTVGEETHQYNREP